MLISDSYVDVKLRDGLTTGDLIPSAANRTAAAGGRNLGGATRYRARLLPHVDGGDLVDLLASHNTVRDVGVMLDELYSSLMCVRSGCGA